MTRINSILNLGSLMMKKNAIAVMTVALTLACISNAQAAWIEDFESYTAGAALSAPWVNADTGVFVSASEGYNPSQGAQFVSGAVTGAFRPADAGTTGATARIFVNNDTGRGMLFFSTGGTGPAANGEPNSDLVSVKLVRYAAGGSYAAMTSADYDAGGNWLSQNGADNGALGNPILVNTWYDVRLQFDATTVTAEYKESSSATWLLIGTLAIKDPVNFAPNYLSIFGNSGGNMDDIVTLPIPEPASLALIGLGGVLLSSRRRNRCG